jgi:hypothetical protein
VEQIKAQFQAQIESMLQSQERNSKVSVSLKTFVRVIAAPAYDI